MLQSNFLKASILLLVLVITASCTKEKSVQSAPVEKSTDNAKDRIQNFITLLDNVKSNKVSDRTAQNMTVEELVWDVEATLNFNYASADVPFKQPLSNVVTYDIAGSSTAVITPTMASAAYQAGLSALSSFYTSITNSVKSVVLIDVYHEVLPSGDIRLYFNSVVGVDNPDYNMNGFNDWKWGLKQGRCNQAVQWDAALELAKEANKRINNPNYYHYFTDIITTERLEYKSIINGQSLVNPNDPNPFNNERDYLIYKNSSNFSNFVSLNCLNPSDMDFYYNGLSTVINMAKPIGKTFASVKADSDFLVLPDASVNKHFFYISYGVMHTEPDNGGPRTSFP